MFLSFLFFLFLSPFGTIVLLPHIGSAAQSTREQMIQMALDNLEAGLEDRPLLASV